MKGKPFKNLKRREWIPWIISVIVVTLSNLITGNAEPMPLVATLVGVTASIFI